MKSRYSREKSGNGRTGGGKSSRKKGGGKSQGRDPGFFFALYFCAILLILVWNLFHCRSFSWDVQKIPVSGETGRGDGVRWEEDGRLELTDSGEIELRFQAWGDPAIRKGTALCGAALAGYENAHSLVFHEEKLKAAMATENGEILAEADLPMVRQTPSIYDENIAYFTFDPSETKGIEKGDSLVLTIRSEGLTRNGVFFTPAEDNEGAPAAAWIYYRKTGLSPFWSLFCFVLEGAAGLAALWLFRIRKMPLFPQAGSGRDRIAGRFSWKNAWKSAAALMVLLLFMAYTFLYVIRPMAESCGAEVLCSDKEAEEGLTLRPGDVIRQEIRPGQDRLAGLGLFLDGLQEEMIPGETREETLGGLPADMEKSGEETEGTGEETGEKKAGDASALLLSWKIYEIGDGKDGAGGGEEDRLLASGSGPVASLQSMKGRLGHDAKGEDLLRAAEETKWLSLDPTVKNSAGTKLLLELSLESSGGDEESSDKEAAEGEAFESWEGSWESPGVRIRTTGSTNGSCFLNGQEEAEEICLLAGYSSNGFMKGLFVRLSLAVLLVFAAMTALLAAKNPSAQAMYLAAALSLGLIFSFMTPAFTVSDERTHIDTIYRMSNELLGIGDLPGPDKLYKRAADVDMSIANTMPVTADRYRAVEEGLLGGVTSEAGGTEGSALVPAYARTALENVTVFNYLPAVIGFSLGRLTGRNLITMVMLARWLNLLACAGVMAAAIRKAPFGKACLAMIGLFPKTLQETASCSYDGMLIAGACFFVACVLDMGVKLESGGPGGLGVDGEGNEGRPGRKSGICVTDVLLLALAGCFLAANKAGTYLPLTGLVLLLPLGAGEAMKKKNRSAFRAFLAEQKNALLLLVVYASVFVAKSLSRVFGMFFRSSGAESIVSGTKTLYSLADFLHSPLSLVTVLVSTLRQRGDGMLGELVGKNLCQRWGFVIAFLFLAFLGILRDRKNEKEPACAMTGGKRLWILVLIGASTLLIFLAMLLGFTQRGLGYVDGLQGRYFLPCLPLLYLMLRTDRICRDGFSDAEIIGAGAFLDLLTFFEILTAYFHVW